MKIEIHGNALMVSPPLREYALRSLLFALGRFGHRIQRVRVSLADVNGPRRGEDKRCKIHVNTRGLGDFVVEDTDAQVRVAIDNASERAGRRIRRTMERRLDERRDPADSGYMPESLARELEGISGEVPHERKARHGTD